MDTVFTNVFVFIALFSRRARLALGFFSDFERFRPRRSIVMKFVVPGSTSASLSPIFTVHASPSATLTRTHSNSILVQLLSDVSASISTVALVIRTTSTSASATVVLVLACALHWTGK